MQEEVRPSHPRKQAFLSGDSTLLLIDAVYLFGTVLCFAVCLSFLGKFFLQSLCVPAPPVLLLRGEELMPRRFHPQLETNSVFRIAILPLFTLQRRQAVFLFARRLSSTLCSPKPVSLPLVAARHRARGIS